MRDRAEGASTGDLAIAEISGYAAEWLDFVEIRAPLLEREGRPFSAGRAKLNCYKKPGPREGPPEGASGAGFREGLSPAPPRGGLGFETIGVVLDRTTTMSPAPLGIDFAPLTLLSGANSAGTPVIGVGEPVSVERHALVCRGPDGPAPRSVSPDCRSSRGSTAMQRWLELLARLPRVPMEAPVAAR